MNRQSLSPEKIGLGNMGKRAASSDEFNMAREIRNLLSTNKELTGREVLDQLRKKFPKQPLNENSCQVAFANARRKLGISTVRKRRPVGAGKKRATRTWSAPARSEAVTQAPAQGLELLLAARQLLQTCGGDAAAATAAIKQVAALQIQ
ncbi:MAG: hypothetical protein KDA91_03530 [Planctomycetaceae bacterium]|nr:hypothetical protein [Planctomycetaceae bacterium]